MTQRGCYPTLPQQHKRAPPMRIRLIAVTWPHDTIQRGPHSTMHAGSRVQGSK